MVPAEWQPFRLELREAAVRNLDALARGRLPALVGALDLERGPVEAAKRAASWLHSRTRYTFEPRLAACAVDECLSRGFTACADVAALVAAVAYAEHASSLVAVVRARPGYAHVVVEVDGVTVDPYAFRALPPDEAPEVARWSLREDLARP